MSNPCALLGDGEWRKSTPAKEALVRNTEEMLRGDPSSTQIQDLLKTSTADLEKDREEIKRLEQKYGDIPGKFRTLKDAIKTAEKRSK